MGILMLQVWHRLLMPSPDDKSKKVFTFKQPDPAWAFTFSTRSK